MDRIKTILWMLWKQEVSADPRDSSFFRALKLSEGVPCHLYSLGVSEKRPFWLAYIFFHFVSMILCVGSRIDKTLKHIFLKVTFLGFCWPWDLDHSSDLEGKKRRWDEWPGWCKTNVAFGFDCRIYTVYHLYIYYTHITYPSVSILSTLPCVRLDAKKDSRGIGIGYRFWSLEIPYQYSAERRSINMYESYFYEVKIAVMYVTNFSRQWQLNTSWLRYFWSLMKLHLRLVQPLPLPGPWRKKSISLDINKKGLKGPAKNSGWSVRL